MHFKMVFIGWIVQAVLCVIFCASLSNIIKGRLRIKARTQAATQDSCAMNRLQWLLAGGWAKKNFFFWLCCEHLQHVRCQIDKVVFLICRRFFLFAARFFIWLCCEHLQRVRCQIDEVVFLICRCFFYLQRVSLFGYVVSICSACVVKLTKWFS